MNAVDDSQSGRSKRPRVRLGVEVLLEEKLDLLQGSRIGVIASAASVDREFRRTIDRIREAPNVRITALFAPEHGLWGASQAGVHVADSVDEETGIAVYSLYGAHKKPSATSLQDVDVLVIDLVDAGCRYWTFLYTMAYALQAAAEAGVRAIVLDRPNPITGVHVEGNILDEAFASFVGLYPIPIRTGLTLGEMALLFNEHFSIGADLDVVQCAGWARGMWFDETGLPFVPPSPNAPTLDTLTLYPGTCLIEGTNLSEGRGTTRPFEIVGAPWINPVRLADRLAERGLPGVGFRPVYFTPYFSKHKETLCGGVHVHVTNRNHVHAVRTGLHVLHALQLEEPKRFAWRDPDTPDHTPMIDLLAGSDSLRRGFDDGLEPDDLLAAWGEALEGFLPIHRRHALYAENSAEGSGGV